jgi:3-oxocholest-4-en-26-oyl-CoA dehydrogenase beta subunit
MDLEPTSDQQEIIDLAGRIVGDHTGVDRLRQLERGGVDHDAELWSALVRADLVGLSLPESVGGGGFGLVEATLVAEIAGARVAPVPYVEVVAAGRCLGRAGDPTAREVAAGAVVVPALREGPDAAELARPSTMASDDGETCSLTGEKRLVSGATAATAYLVSAVTGSDVGLFAVDAGAVAGHRDSTSMTGRTMRTIVLEGTPGRRVRTGDGSVALGNLRHDLRVLRCGQLAGVAAGAVHLSADHCRQREQFGAPIGTFQAVAHRMADAWLDAELVRATARQAAWRSDNDLPAEQAAASAALWACEGAHRVVHAAQHVHGGIGVDVDYPVHRYFRASKELELQLGGASACARDLGAAIASEPLTIG